MRKNFELFKLKNAIKKNGKELVVKRDKKNEFGEETIIKKGAPAVTQINKRNV